MPILRTIRYGGLLAACLLSLAGLLGGAFPHGDLASTPANVWRGPHGPLILCCWLAGTAALGWAWWAIRDRVPSPRWAMTTIALWAARSSSFRRWAAATPTRTPARATCTATT